MSDEIKICSSCWEEDCVCDYEQYITLDAGIADIIVTLNLKGYRTSYCCEGHIEEDTGDTHPKLLNIYIVCPNHRFETLPEGFSYPKALKHKNFSRSISYKYINGTLRARINGKYIPYDLESDRENHLIALKQWANELPPIDIRKHPECFSEYMVTGQPRPSFLSYNLHKKY